MNNYHLIITSLTFWLTTVYNNTEGGLEGGEGWRGRSGKVEIIVTMLDDLHLILHGKIQ